uniref:Uncharacterized protein n=1 Tax=Anguilla anguilla TaxID=7936 RepID=A0A0E9QIX1_ANGAN
MWVLTFLLVHRELFKKNSTCVDGLWLFTLDINYPCGMTLRLESMPAHTEGDGLGSSDWLCR